MELKLNLTCFTQNVTNGEVLVGSPGAVSTGTARRDGPARGVTDRIGCRH